MHTNELECARDFRRKASILDNANWFLREWTRALKRRAHDGYPSLREMLALKVCLRELCGCVDVFEPMYLTRMERAQVRSQSSEIVQAWQTVRQLNTLGSKRWRSTHAHAYDEALKLLLANKKSALHRVFARVRFLYRKWMPSLSDFLPKDVPSTVIV